MYRIIIILCSILFIASNVTAENYQNIGADYFNQYKNDDVFTDDQGNILKVKNTSLNKGLYLKSGDNWLRHGTHYLYQKNGKLLTEITYLKDVKNGPFKQYHPDGSLCFDYNYLNNKRHGPYYQYRDNEAKNTIFNKFNYVNGKKEGKAYRYDNKGVVTREYNYVNNRRHGEAIIYNPQTGEPARTQVYNNGALQLDPRELLAN